MTNLTTLRLRIASIALTLLCAMGTALGASFTDNVYLVGDFSSWDAYTSNIMTAKDGHYEGVLPSYANQFNVRIGKSGTTYYGEDGSGKTTTGNTHVYTISQGGQNIVIPEYCADGWNCIFHSDGNQVLIWPVGEECAVQISTPEPEVPTLGSRLMVLSSDDTVEPTKDNFPTIHEQYSYLEPDGSGFYYGQISYTPGKKIRLLYLLADDAANATLFAPEADLDLAPYVYHQYVDASYKRAKPAASGYWQLPDADAGLSCTTVHIEVNSSSKKVRFIFDDSGRIETGKSDKLYIIGSPSGWVSPYESNEPKLAVWALRATTDGGFYGSFDMPSGAKFRFYSALQGYDVGSFGYATGDYETSIDFSGEEASYNLTPGKGQYKLDSWAGGTMYIYANLQQGKVYFSANPMEHEVGLPADTEIYVYDLTAGKWLATATTGVEGQELRCVTLEEGELAGHQLRLYTQRPSWTPDMAGWDAKNTLSAPQSGYAAEFDGQGVAEFAVTWNNDAATTAANAFTVPEGVDSPILVVDIRNWKAYLDRGDTFYLYGALTGGEIPTYATRSQYAGVAYSHPQSHFIADIPAGKLDYQLMRLWDPRVTNESQALAFDETGCALVTEAPCFVHPVASDWAGGKIYHTPTAIQDLGKLAQLQAYNGDALAQLDKRGDLAFSGSLLMGEGDDQSLTFSFGGHFFLGAASDEACSVSLADDGTATLALVAGGKPFEVPAAKGLNVDIAVDLGTMQAKLAVAKSGDDEGDDEKEDSGVQQLAGGSEGGARYYSLQGIEVTRPQHGVFVKVEGGKVTKVKL